MKVNLPTKNKGFYIHKNNGVVDYSFETSSFSIAAIRCSKGPIRCFVLPKIDYSENDEFLDDRDFDAVKHILRPALRKEDAGFQYYILSCLKNPKVSLDDQVIKTMAKISACGGRQINICVTGNATMILPSKDFSANEFCNVNLVLPKGMGLYNVVDNYCELQDAQPNGQSGYIIVAPKLLEARIDFRGYFKVIPIKEWQGERIKLVHDQTKYFNRQTNEIVEGNVARLDANLD